MDRVAFGAILLLALALWVNPYLTGSKDAGAAPSAVARSVESSSPRLATPAGPSASNSVPAPTISRTIGKAGFWRLAQTSAGVWWFLSPSGQTEFLNTVTTVQPYQFGRDKDGIHFVSRDFNGKPGGEGDLDAWARKTLDRIMGMGFKGIGAWSNPVFHKLDVPITRDLNVWGWMPPAAQRFYTPEWSTTAEYAIQYQVTPLKDNLNLVGYFIDNELEWGDERSGPAAYFDNLPPDDPNRREVVKIIQSIWGTVDEFNRDWDAQIKEWKDLEAWATLPHERQQAYSRLFSAWLSHLAEDYFKLTCGLIRKYDPNHLILGVRFRGYAPREVVRASRDYTDAQSLNYYVADARLDLDMFKMMYEESGQPVMVTEYSFHSLDGRSGNRNTVGFAAQVLDQQARADGYRLFTTRCARVPFIVGVDWFQWSDEPPSGRSSDGEDVNFGIVDVDDVAYEALANAVSQVGPVLNALHAESFTDAQTDVWREDFAKLPAMHVPRLARSIYLNGELSDWSMQSKLMNVKHSQTVGLERSKLPLPNVFMGWTEEGLYLAFEVFDNDINGAPPKGWWWTRDYIEFWISTRPTTREQNGYDVYSHQFFFVPDAWPGPDGRLGTVGQWHRGGDALKDHLIPHPDIRNAVRVLPDRYVVEMLIPARALHGFDPQREPTMAFNMHVRNFQHATDYFWSAPKEVMTQVRPSTWGPLYLETSTLAQSDPVAPDPARTRVR